MSNQRYRGSHSEAGYSVCKTVYAGSIPAVASTHLPTEIRTINGLAARRTNESGESRESSGEQRRHKREHSGLDAAIERCLATPPASPKARARHGRAQNAEILTPKIAVGRSDPLLARLQRGRR